MKQTDTNKQNIAIVIPGGVGTGKNNIGVPVLEQIIKQLAKDFNLTVFQLYKVNQDYQVKGFELIDIYSSNRFVKGFKFFIAFRAIHKKKNFSSVHGFWIMPCGFFAVLVGKLFGIKSIVSVLGGDAVSLPEIQYGQFRSPVNKKLILWTLRQATEVTSLTQYLVDNLKQYGFTRKNVKIIPWGIDTALFIFTDKSFSKPIQFLHIANLHPVKDQETLLRAFKIISDKISAQLTIIGEGISESMVVDLISQLKLQDIVTVHELIPYQELAAYYHRSDILLHTSLSEGQSEVVTEAMSCGVLVCGTKVGLMYDLPDGCLSVPSKDFLALAAGVLQLIGDAKQMQNIRQRAYEWAHDHSLEWTVKEHKKLYSLL